MLINQNRLRWISKNTLKELKFIIQLFYEDKDQNTNSI